MPIASMKISQAALPATPAGFARDDIAKGVPVVLRNDNDAGVTSHRWTMLWKPPGSTAVIINPTSAVANFTPDLDGVSYRLELAVNQGRASHGETQIKVFRVRDASGFAAPAAGERGSESNYLVNGNPNTIAWADEFERRYLYGFNNRGAPFHATLLAGANTTFEIPWTLPDAMLKYLRIFATSGADLEVVFFADAAKTRVMYEISNVDATNPPLGYVIAQHRTLTYNDPPTVPEDDKIYLRVRNNDGVSSTFDIYLRIGAV